MTNLAQIYYANVTTPYPSYAVTTSGSWHNPAAYVSTNPDAPLDAVISEMQSRNDNIGHGLGVYLGQLLGTRNATVPAYHTSPAYATEETTESFYEPLEPLVTNQASTSTPFLGRLWQSCVEAVEHVSTRWDSFTETVEQTSNTLWESLTEFVKTYVRIQTIREQAKHDAVDRTVNHFFGKANQDKKAIEFIGGYDPYFFDHHFFSPLNLHNYYTVRNEGYEIFQYTIYSPSDMCEILTKKHSDTKFDLMIWHATGNENRVRFGKFDYLTSTNEVKFCGFTWMCLIEDLNCFPTALKRNAKIILQTPSAGSLEKVPVRKPFGSEFKFTPYQLANYKKGYNQNIALNICRFLIENGLSVEIAASAKDAYSFIESTDPLKVISPIFNEHTYFNVNVIYNRDVVYYLDKGYDLLKDMPEEDISESKILWQREFDKNEFALWDAMRFRPSDNELPRAWQLYLELFNRKTEIAATISAGAVGLFWYKHRKEAQQAQVIQALLQIPAVQAAQQAAVVAPVAVAPQAVKAQGRAP